MTVSSACWPITSQPQGGSHSQLLPRIRSDIAGETTPCQKTCA